MKLAHTTQHHPGISFLFLRVFMVCPSIVIKKLYMAFYASYSYFSEIFLFSQKAVWG